ncbi:MAG: cation:proton antiporter [Armatimonadetes bacterium]|nr:cation:proton antiporter [Armatimonadota bacterium]
MLPAYLLGVAVARVFARERDLVRRLRTTAFVFLTPFYFIRAGSLVSLGALWSGAGMVALLLGAKMVSKIVGIYPVTRLFRFAGRKAWYITLLMCTGLTFGTISAMFGYSRGIITREQYSFLVAAVIASAVVPTMMAQAWFRPSQEEAPFVVAYEAHTDSEEDG